MDQSIYERCDEAAQHMLAAARRHIKADSNVWEMIKTDYREKAWKAYLREIGAKLCGEAEVVFRDKLGVGPVPVGVQPYGLCLRTMVECAAVTDLEHASVREYFIERALEQLQTQIDQFKVTPFSVVLSFSEGVFYVELNVIQPEIAQQAVRQAGEQPVQIAVLRIDGDGVVRSTLKKPPQNDS